MKTVLRQFAAPLLACFTTLCGDAYAQAGALQDTKAVTEVVEQFLRLQTAQLPGTPMFNISELNARMLPPSCPQLQAFLPNGNRPWGKTIVGVRCAAPRWERYIPATVTVVGDYIAASAPLAAGQVLTSERLSVVHGDLTAMPPGLVTELGQVEGRILNIAIQAGAPLRLDALRSVPVIQQGQMVQVVALGKGFRVSTEARALGNAKEGQLVQLKTEAGRQISGIAKAGGMVEIAN